LILALSFQIQKGLDSVTSLCGRSLTGSWEKKEKVCFMDQKKIDKLYELLEEKERKKDTEAAVALRWAIFELENRR